MPSPWVTRAQDNDLPSQAYRGEPVGRVTYTNDDFDEDAPIGTQESDTRAPERLTMQIEKVGRPRVRLVAGLDLLGADEFGLAAALMVYPVGVAIGLLIASLITGRAL